MNLSKSMAKMTFFVLVAIFGLEGCSHSKNGSSKQGGQDGGGGHVKISSPEQVIAAIQHSLDLAKESQARFNIFYSFLSETIFVARSASNALDGRIPKKTEEFEVNTASIAFKTILGAPPKCIFGKTLDVMKCLVDQIHKIKNYEKRFSVFISQSPIDKKTVGECVGGYDHHADASVSAFKEGATICFSVEELQRLPPSSLDREILSLLLHEAAHLSGFS